jgi:hypothetical protein
MQCFELIGSSNHGRSLKYTQAVFDLGVAGRAPSVGASTKVSPEREKTNKKVA